MIFATTSDFGELSPIKTPGEMLSQPQKTGPVSDRHSLRQGHECFVETSATVVADPLPKSTENQSSSCKADSQILHKPDSPHLQLLSQNTFAPRLWGVPVKLHHGVQKLDLARKTDLPPDTAKTVAALQNIKAMLLNGKTF